MTPTKLCSYCHETKPTTEFHPKPPGTYADGSPRYQSRCKRCANIARNKYRARIRTLRQQGEHQ